MLVKRLDQSKLVTERRFGGNLLQKGAGSWSVIKIESGSLPEL